MKFSTRRFSFQKYRRFYLSAGLIAVIAIILWNSYLLFNHMKQEERAKMEIWSEAVQKIIRSPLNADIDLPSRIVIRNKTIPVIMTDSTGRILQVYNLEKIENDTAALRRKLALFASQNEPLEIRLPGGSQKLYYGHSRLLNQLTWYPLVLILIFLLFASVVYLYNRTVRVSEQNLLWAGMAKEAAHQIGTPLSSLIGWTELLRADPSLVDPDEMEKDIRRLKVISDRFGKIGSRPHLTDTDLCGEVRRTVDYFRRRLPAGIRLEAVCPQKPVVLRLNSELFQWVLENLVKNAMDAMGEHGEIRLLVHQTPTHVYVDVSDTGKGIPRRQWKKIFEPGFTTKKRGWGLGLSLVKRIVENYHQGSIFVKKSAPGQGTLIRIKMKKRKS